VRGESLNPILKNTLFEMMNKEPTKRLDLLEAKRRLSLQKYITTESRSTLTITSRTTRKQWFSINIIIKIEFLLSFI